MLGTPRIHAAVAGSMASGKTSRFKDLRSDHWPFSTKDKEERNDMTISRMLRTQIVPLRRRPFFCMQRLFLIFAVASTVLGEEQLAAERNSAEQAANAQYSTSVPRRNYTRSEPALAVSAPPASADAIPDLVPKSWIIEAVKEQAQNRWSVYAIGTPIPCSDAEGKLICYQVPVIVGADRFPETLTPPPASEVAAVNLRSRELWGIPDYWTFVVSAKRAHYPIPAFGEGLPAFLVTYHKAVELAQTRLADSRVRVAHYYSLGHNGDYFGFIAESGRQLLINAHTLQVYEFPAGADIFDSGKGANANGIVTKSAAESENIRRDYESRASEAWAKISNRAENTKN